MASDRINHHSDRHRDLTYRRYATALVAGVLLAAGAVGGLTIGMELGRPAMFNGCLCLAIIGAMMMTAAFGGNVEVIAQVDERVSRCDREITEIKGDIVGLTEALRRVAAEGARDADELGRRRSGGGR